jgi:hypothetical protein
MSTGKDGLVPELLGENSNEGCGALDPGMLTSVTVHSSSSLPSYIISISLSYPIRFSARDGTTFLAADALANISQKAVVEGSMVWNGGEGWY